MINELNDERYVQIDALVSKEAVNKFIDATENIQIELMNSNVDAKEIYQYLVTIMLNQC
jgi:hypothetical protein